MPGGFPLGLELCNANDQGTDLSNSRGAAVSTNTTAGVYGSFVQLVAASPYDTSYALLSVGSIAGLNNQNNLSLNLAIGGAGSELNIVSNLLLCVSGNVIWNLKIPLPLSIPAGSRISVQVAGQNTGADTVYVQIQLFDAAFTQSEGYSGAEAVGWVANGIGTSATSGAANTKGAYSQLAASTPRDYAGFIVTCDAVGTAVPKGVCLVDIALGSAGNEVVIFPNFWIEMVGNPIYRHFGFFPIPIPAGSRVTARFQEAVGGVAGLGIALLGVYQ